MTAASNASPILPLTDDGLSKRLHAVVDEDAEPVDWAAECRLPSLETLERLSRPREGQD